MAADAAKTLASEWLSSKMREITDPFQMAITAYALQVTNHRDKDNAFARLTSMRRAGMLRNLIFSLKYLLLDTILFLAV